MFHYHRWFNLKQHIVDRDGIAAVRDFLDQQQATGQISRFCVLKNTAEAPKTILQRYHALIEFSDGAQFSRAFSDLRAGGIHAGMHGVLMEMIADFRVEIFTDVTE